MIRTPGKGKGQAAPPDRVSERTEPISGFLLEAAALCTLLANVLGLKLEPELKNLQGLLKQIPWPHPKISGSVGVGWGSRICISDKFPAH